MKWFFSYDQQFSFVASTGSIDDIGESNHSVGEGISTLPNSANSLVKWHGLERSSGTLFFDLKDML